MSPKDFCPEQRAPSSAFSNSVILSRWVNERFPAWGQLLSAHDVARLTRRPQWMVLSLVLLADFPANSASTGAKSVGYDLTCSIGWRRIGATRRATLIRGPLLSLESRFGQRCQSAPRVRLIQSPRSPRPVRIPGNG
jgi:hypothetical protein